MKNIAAVADTPISMKPTRNFFFAALKSASAPSSGAMIAMRIAPMVLALANH